MVDLSRLMQDAAILEVIDKSADEASNLSAQNSYQAMSIGELEQQIAERDAELAALKRGIELAIKDAWEMIDPLNPPPVGSYNLWHHNGVVDALRQVRVNYESRLRAEFKGE